MTGLTDLPGTPPGRPTISGAFNFRDLGGLRAGPGHRTRSGVLFRSDTLQALTAEDVAHVVDELRPELIVDLRTGGEAVAQGRGPLARAPICYLNAPLHEAPVSDLPAGEQTLAFYLVHLESPTSKAATVVRVVCALVGRPVVVHCAAGKDRTGLVIALLLRLAGVDDAEIVADYMRSAPAMPRIVERFRTWPHYADHMAAVAPEVYETAEHTITGFLAALDRRHGGAVGWARSRGITDGEITRLRAGLLVPDGDGPADT
ncbi:MAG: tyrosine-protein phosphatase [Pseudonocardia sp.]